jgi:DNA polymerase III, delta subunit
LNLLPWPEEFLATADWPAVGRLLRRCVQASRRGLLPHTLMLLGGPGLGREALAIELAAALICRRAETSPCTCHACQRVRRGVHPDLAVLDVEPDRTQIRLEQVQELVEGLAQVPFEGARRVVILTSAQTPPLNWDAASALLKALEEPPGHVTFLLLASNPRRVLATIVSRSVHVHLPSPDAAAASRLVAALHGLNEETCAALLASVGGDSGPLLVGDDAELVGTLELAAAIAPEALRGDVLAIVRLGQLAARSSGGLGLLASLLLAAVERGVVEAEAALNAVIELLRAEYRGAVLHIGAEALVTGAIATIMTSSGQG